MSNESKLKVVLLGPVSSGKTTIANFLSENTVGDCRPTKGVRIVEVVAPGVRTTRSYQNTLDLHLWDCSGDISYQSCWPAIQHKADGFVFIYNKPSNQQKSDLDMLYSFFVEEPGFPESCCIVIRNEMTSENNWNEWKNPLSSLTHFIFSSDDKNSEFQKNFNSFLSTIAKSNFND